MTPPPDWLEAAQAVLDAFDGTGTSRTSALDALRRAVKHEEGLRENARIRTEPLLPVVRTRDAAGVMRTGRAPEQEDEGER